MRHILFGDNSDNLSIALLIKDSSMMATELHKHYVSQISKSIPVENVCAFSLSYDASGKVSAKQAKDYLTTMLKALDSLNVKTLLVADSAYFKYLTGVKKVEPHYGYILPCSIKGFEHISCILSTNYGALFYNPDMKSKIDISLTTLVNHVGGSHVDAGLDIIHSAKYPIKLDVATTLMGLKKYPALTCDIETTGLRFNSAEIYTISFAWDKHNGVAFLIDTSMLHWLRDFFIYYTGKLWFHNALFDVKFLIYHCFMDGSTNYVGMREGLDVFAKVNDTMLYCYLALNSTADIKLGLKPNSFEYTGNYALDDEAIHDVTKIPLDDLLRYNLIDSLATWYVKEKYEPVLIAEDQMRVYDNIMQPSIKPLLEMMLMGLPLDLAKTATASIKLEAVRDVNSRIVKSSKITKEVEFQLQILEMNKANAKLKKKVKSIDDFRHEKFNPASPTQVGYMLYEYMKLPVIDMTKTKQPATGQKTLRKLVAHTTNPEYIKLLEALIELAQSSKILNDFIKNFQSLYFKRADDTVWLNGDQVLGGTQSGRLSARNPNLANLPSNSIYGKTIKSCFVAPAGWLFGGADFNALNYSGALAA